VIFLISASWEARITGVSHWCPENKHLYCYVAIKNKFNLKIKAWQGGSH
jgi:hypothetical protein